MKKVYSLCSLLLLVFILAGCGSLETMDTESASTIGKDTEVTSKELDFKSTDISHKFSVNNTEFGLKTTYKVDSTRFKKWLFTVPSDIYLSIKMSGFDDSKYDIYVNNLYSEVSVNSSYPQIAGTRQDSINLNHDSMKESGFNINTINNYSVPFQVEGINSTSTKIVYYNGSGYSYTDRVTERDMRRGAKSARLKTVWTIIVKDKETGNQYHTTIFDKLDISIGDDE